MKCALAILAFTAPAQGIVHHAPAVPKFEFGSPKCPCVGLAGLEGSTQVSLSKNVTENYPADFAARCAAWDNNRNTLYCLPGQKPGADNGWCAEPWCYVDPCNCDLDEPATRVGDDGYMPNVSYQGVGLWYSYKTCGGTDYYMDAEKKKKHQEAPGVCNKTVDEKKWGKESCRCVGYSDVEGRVNVTINVTTFQYPAETGATCEAWDAKRHPDCTGEKPADWCKQSWCYVDPCECKLAVSPKTSSYLPSGMLNGKPVYFSYAACESKDTFTATNKEACVNQESKDNCTALDKCAWTGKDCLGKELAETCLRSGAGAIKATFALALAFFGLCA